MIDVCVLTKSPVHRAGLAALLKEAPAQEDIRMIEQDEDASAIPGSVFILFDEELDTFLNQIANEKVIVIVSRDNLTGLSLREREMSWGIISIEATGEALRAAIIAVAHNMVVISHAKTSSLLFEFQKTKGEVNVTDRQIDMLTDRELEILGLVAKGMQNKQIAYQLGISDNTVKFHVSVIFSKLGVTNRTEALRVGSKVGLISL